MNEIPTPLRQARLVPYQDDNGFHLCLGFVQSVEPDGRIVFDNQGKVVISYSSLAVATQDLEICLAHARHCLANQNKTS